MTTARDSTIENLNTNKRKFISDDEVYPPSARFLSINTQVPTSCNTKKIKSVETERLSSTIIEEDDMMICENSNSEVNDTNTSQGVLVSQHCTDISKADANPTTLFIRCYCDPYRLNGFIPYHADIF